MVTPVVVEFVTPALAQTRAVPRDADLLPGRSRGISAATWSSLFSERDAKLRFLRIANDVEHNLGSYVAVVTVINVALGVVVAAGAWLFGFPNPLIFGLLAAILNYIPYIGPACMAIVLFGVGLVTFPTLGYALLPPACFVALTTLEGHLITPTILGRTAHAQSAGGVSRACVLDLAVGTDGRLPGGAAVDRRAGDHRTICFRPRMRSCPGKWNFLGPAAVSRHRHISISTTGES